MQGQSTPDIGASLVSDWFSMVQSCVSNSLSLASNAENKLHLLYLPLSLKEAGE